MNLIMKSLLSAWLVLGLAGCMAPVTHEPPNLSAVKAEVAAYESSGRYEADLSAVAASAETWITRRARNGEGKLAIILDIDETVLSNLKHMRESDWGYHPTRWAGWMAEADAPAIPPVRAIYQCARRHQVAVFFITGRTEASRHATIRNLKAQGMGDYAGLIVRPNGAKETAAVFKADQRRRISEQGYTIIANIGDQQSDLEGGWAERNFKLPNPFYTIR